MGKSDSRSTAWLCKCDCGNEKILSTNRLNDKRLKTCGECTKKSRLGETFTSRCGLKGTLTKYINTDHVEVTLEVESVCKTRYGRVYFYCMDSDGIEDVKTLKEIKEKEA